MRIEQVGSFARTVKKLSRQQKVDLDSAVADVAANPLVGEAKIGDLAGIRVHKFFMQNQLALLAYVWREDGLILTLLKLGSHENFYRDLKREV